MRLVLEILVIMFGVTVCAAGWLHIIGQMYEERHDERTRAHSRSAGDDDDE